MNMFFHELGSMRKSLIIWNLSITAAVILMLAIYPSFAEDAGQLTDLLSAYPEAFQDALGISPEILTSLLGYYSYIFTYVLLFAAIQAMNMGVAILSKETRMKTADFLLTKPVKRVSVLTAKVMAAVTGILLTNIVYFFVSFSMLMAVKTDRFSQSDFIKMNLSMLLLQLFFLSLGLLVAVFLKKIKSVIGVSLSFVFGLYIIGMVGALLDIENFRYFSPFKYVDYTYLLAQHSFEWNFIFTEVIVIVVFMMLTYRHFQRKDIHSL